MFPSGERNPRRVAYVVKRYPRFSETFIVNEILAHEADGLEIEIFALRPPVDTHFQNSISRVRAPVTYLPNGGLKAVDLWEVLDEASQELPNLWANMPAASGEDGVNVYQAVALAQLIRRRNIDHIHAHFASSASGVARLAARIAGISYTVTAHAKDIFHESVLVDDLQRKFSDAAGVVTVSDFNLKFIKESYSGSVSNIERIYNGLDLAEFRFDSPEMRPPRVVSVSRLVEKKGIRYLLEACAILAERGRRFECIVIGGGDLETDLHDQVNELNLQERVEFIGPRPQNEVFEIVQNSSVCAAPCIVGVDGNRDGLPTVLLEAMALGTPCVSTDVTGIPELIRHEETGLMVPQRDPVALAAALERLLEDSDLRVRLAKNARRLIETEFDATRNSAVLRSLFRRARERRLSSLRSVV